MSRALDVVYALWVDELDPPRSDARARLDGFLLRPFDAEEAEQWDRDRWGMSSEQMAAQLQTERLMGGE